MPMTDPVADMLTRIRNANKMRYEQVLIPASKLKLAILDVLVKEGFVASYKVMKKDEIKEQLKKKNNDDFKKLVGGNYNQDAAIVSLKYTEKNERVIKGLKRISKPGLRVYASVENLPKVLNGIGIAIISTSKGVISDKEARNAKVGGEVLAYIW